jgi:hypothetical protein
MRKSYVITANPSTAELVYVATAHAALFSPSPWGGGCFDQAG